MELIFKKHPGGERLLLKKRILGLSLTEVVRSLTKRKERPFTRVHQNEKVEFEYVLAFFFSALGFDWYLNLITNHYISRSIYSLNNYRHGACRTWQPDHWRPTQTQWNHSYWPGKVWWPHLYLNLLQFITISMRCDQSQWSKVWMCSQAVIDGMLKEIAFALIKSDVNIKVYNSNWKVCVCVCVLKTPT